MAHRQAHKRGSHSRNPVARAPGSPSSSSSKPATVATPKRPVFTGPLYSWKLFFPGTELVYATTTSAADDAISRLVSPGQDVVVGLDLEWKPTRRAGEPENCTALIQLSSEKMIVLLQISSMEDFPRSLWDFLQSSSSAKVGVGIQYDCTKLFKDFGASVRNCVDLSLLARSADPQWKGNFNKPLGLAHLTEVYLEHLLPKGKVQRSNWEARLSEEQQEYAANDAQSALAIYNELITKAAAMVPVPERDCYSFDVIDGKLRDFEGRPWFPFNPHYDPGEIPTVKVAAPVDV
ncbi:ribonuclease H-like domain-containing protein [Amylostereum chailletii]|nr:ribonuclease H-like domain-containing protein [Amylostereum chailletii]